MKDQMEYIYHELCKMQGHNIELSVTHPQQVNLYQAQRLDDLTAKVGQWVDHNVNNRVADALMKNYTKAHYQKQVAEIRAEKEKQIDEHRENERLKRMGNENVIYVKFGGKR